MPVTRTAKRALRASNRKNSVNSEIKRKLEIALRRARTSKTEKVIKEASSIADRAAKKKLIHKNKASRIKASLSKLAKKPSAPKTTKKNVKKAAKKTSKKK